MDIIIIGAGVSGIATAIFASVNPNNNITIIEKNNKPLKKLLLTGNGKCNFTNLNFNVNDKSDILKYYNNDFFYKSYMSFNNISLIKFFNDIGIEVDIQKKYDQIYVYPRTYDSKSVYYNLIDLINSKNNVNIIYNEEVNNIDFNNEFIINNKYKSNALVISTGGKSYKNTGSDGKIFDILQNKNISIIKPLASLCGFNIKNLNIQNLKNIRIICNTKLFINDEYIDEQFGEIQLTNDTISAIPIMQLSRKISKSLDKNEKVSIYLDFLYDKNDLISIKNEEDFINRINNLKYKKLEDVLCGFVNEHISKYLIKKYDKNLKNIYKELKNFKIEIISPMGFDYAQCTTGGVSTSEIDDTTYKHKIIKNLYFTGEVIDVDGICGGYNLQFAFSSANAVAKNFL